MIQHARIVKRFLLSPQLRRAFEAASERGASCWLTTLPIAEHGFALSKQGRIQSLERGGAPF